MADFYQFHNMTKKQILPWLRDYQESSE